ncbi:PREDICTED: uncharacterized protein LOC106789919 [Polistes canadensis]|uniref:uncharacterized protein LOC106789919 n=1 Tax=Polistes canadensis TaxID=91411 RepID=UPI000718DB8E|nr:PREDICTED: uncharacterized protein LOC106789919 [Polistes canadensis]
MSTLYKNTNSINKFENVNKKKSKRIRRRRLSKEWIFSLIIFLVLSLIIVEKIYFSYVLSIMIKNANDLYNKVDVYNKIDLYNKANVYNKTDLYNATDVNNKADVNKKADVKMSSYLYDSFTLSNIVVNVEKAYNILVQQIVIIGETFANTICYCYHALFDALLYKTYDHPYEIMIVGIILGIIATSASWFIIYMDSRIPGNDPAFPLFLQKYWIKIALPINLNYFVGALIGLLITICYLYENHYFDS